MKNDHGNERNWDVELDAPAQQSMRRIVRELPEEPLSLAWRSDLNARLRLEAAGKVRRAALAWIWKPAAGLALAGGLALVIFLRTPPEPRSTASADIEGALIGSYVDNTASWEITGDGVTATEARDISGSKDAAPAWYPEDIGAAL